MRLVLIIVLSQLTPSAAFHAAVASPHRAVALERRVTVPVALSAIAAAPVPMTLGECVRADAARASVQCKILAGSVAETVRSLSASVVQQCSSCASTAYAVAIPVAQQAVAAVAARPRLFAAIVLAFWACTLAGRLLFRQKLVAVASPPPTKSPGVSFGSSKPKPAAPIAKPKPAAVVVKPKPAATKPAATKPAATKATVTTTKPKEAAVEEENPLLSFATAIGLAAADAVASTAEALISTAAESTSVVASGKAAPKATVGTAKAGSVTVPKVPNGAIEETELWRDAMQTMSEMKDVIRDQVIMLEQLKARVDELEVLNTAQTNELNQLKKLKPPSQSGTAGARK